jgi:hypothetical protein
MFSSMFIGGGKHVFGLGKDCANNKACTHTSLSKRLAAVYSLGAYAVIDTHSLRFYFHNLFSSSNQLFFTFPHYPPYLLITNTSYIN